MEVIICLTPDPTAQAGRACRPIRITIPLPNPPFSVCDIMDTIRALLRSCYSQYGWLRVLQICGIPMGISPAPYMANLFLGWYEYCFLLQRYHPSCTPVAAAILDTFRFSKRFLDDLLALNNRHLSSFLFRHDVGPLPAHGLLGLYPPCLDVPVQEHPHLPAAHIPFLDILLVHQPTTGATPTSRFTTRLYDKRDQPAFHDVRLSRYIPRCSNVNEAAKRNIFASQFHRLRAIILDIDDFALQAARLVVALTRQGYSFGQLLQRTNDALLALPHLFPIQRRTTHRDLFPRIQRQAQVLLALPPTLYPLGPVPVGCRRW